MIRYLSVIVAMLFALMLWPSAAHATRCGWFDAENEFPGAELGSKVMHCFGTPRYPGQDEHTYTLYQPAKKGPLGICAYSFAQVFITTDANGKKRWGYHRPDSPHYVPKHTGAMMEAVNGKCPPQNDPRYISISGASEGVLRLILQRWQQIIHSPEVQTRFVGDMRDTVFDELAQRRKDGLGPHIRISSISQTNSGDGFHYRIGFVRTDNDLPTNWGLVVDLTDDSLVWLATIKSTY